MSDVNVNSSVHERITAAGAKLGLDVSRETSNAIAVYVEQLLKWNKTYNLTALRSVEDVLTHHIFDCMSILSAIEKKVGRDNFTVVDVGSGAGLPGVIIGLWFPKSRVVCVDTVEKKTTFIRYVSGTMGCKNIEARHARIEELDPQQADIVISRAFSSLTLFTTLAGKHCSENGMMVSMKSAQVQEDLAELDNSASEWCLESLEELDVPEVSARRNLVWLQRKK